MTTRSAQPLFEIPRQPRFGGLWQSLGVLLSSGTGNRGGVWPFRSYKENGALKPVGGVLSSLVLHAAAIFLITHVNLAPPVRAAQNLEVSEPAPIYLDLQALKELKILRALPVVKPAGPGGQPGISDHPRRVIFRASTVQHPKYTVVLHPMKPDNSRQAINQKLAAPEMKIRAEQKVPNIVLAEAPAPAKPQVDMSLHQPLAPDAQNRQVDPAPTVAANAPELPFKTSSNVPRPQLPITAMRPVAPENAQNQPAEQAPAVAGSAQVVPFVMASSATRPQLPITAMRPVARGNEQNGPAEAAPSVSSNGPELALNIAPTVSQPKLPVTTMSRGVARAAGQQSGSAGPAPDVASAVGAAGQPNKLGSLVSGGSGTKQPQMPSSYFSSNSLKAPRAGGSASGRPGGTGANSDGAGDAASGDVVISVDPGTFAKLASLAQGNRYGMLAIAPSKPGVGSPGGSANETGVGGSGGPGKAGEASSSGVGPGKSGGGGGGPESQAVATFSAVGGSGKTGGVDANKLLGAVLPSTVYAVPSATKLRRPPLVVSTGPIGGGGLDAYNALHCGKVYTIFLPMPGKSWVLQYCAHPGAAGNSDPPKSSVVQLEEGLVPPAADQQFDFHRLPIPEKDADKMIVLRAQIDKQGSINGVEVYQGVLPEMDAQAALAFGNWKFKPATRANLPIGVDVLVGIPARLPEKGSGSSVKTLGSQYY